MWKIGAGDIRSFALPLPPLSVQRELVGRIQEARAESAARREAVERRATAVKADVEAMILGTKPVF